MTVNGVEPVSAPFWAMMLLTPGESNVKYVMKLLAPSLREVPVMALTTTPRVCAPTPPVVGLHVTVVAVVHEALAHTVDPRAALTVVSDTAKLRPPMVRTEPAEAALFGVLVNETMGVS
jgi:hypothetical protein